MEVREESKMFYSLEKIIFILLKVKLFYIFAVRKIIF